MKCPGCNEINEAGMQFCIFCGYGLAPTQAPSPTASQIVMPVQSAEEQLALSRPLASSQAFVLVCTVCNKSDPLNGQFCVFCAGRTVPGPAAAPITPQLNYSVAQPMMTSQTMQPVTRNLSEERSVPVHPQNKANNGKVAGLIIWLPLAIILGASSSFGAIYAMKADLQKTALKSIWPGEGLLVFSSAKNADLRIENTKQKSLIFGKTSASGTLHLQDIEPGSYELILSDKSGKESKTTFNIQTGSAAQIGYPSRLELK